MESLILKKRSEGTLLSGITKEKLQTTVFEIIETGTAIIGCDTTATAYYDEILRREVVFLVNKLGYSDLTNQEIKLAVQLNQTHSLEIPKGIEIEQVEFSGKCFNTNFLSRVLKNYMTIRNLIDRKIQNAIDGF